MPIEYEVDHERRVVVARGKGVLAQEDFVAYQNVAWSRPDVTGYSELVDMRGVEDVVLPTADGMRALASLSAGMDAHHGSTKMAIIASQDFAYGLGRMYEAYRSFQPASTKEVAVFRTPREALAFLGLDAALGIEATS